MYGCGVHVNGLEPSAVLSKDVRHIQDCLRTVDGLYYDRAGVGLAQDALHVQERTVGIIGNGDETHHVPERGLPVRCCGAVARRLRFAAGACMLLVLG